MTIESIPYWCDAIFWFLMCLLVAFNIRYYFKRTRSPSQIEQDENFKRALAEKIDDKDPSHWVELDKLRKRYTK